MRSNLFLIVGEDKKIIDFSLYEILNNIDYDDNNKIVYDMNVDKFMDVMEEASMVSLFSPIKVIVVDNFVIDNISDDEIGYLNRYIDSNNKDVYMIFITNKVDARKKSYKLFKDNFKIIEVEKVDGNSIIDYVVNRVKNNNFKINNIDAEYFVSKVGNDINNINNELNKLFVYKDEDKKILKDDIDLLVFDNIDNVVYEFTNAILDEDYNKIKSMYDKFILDNVGVDYLIVTVSNCFRTNLIIKLLSSKNMSNFEIGKVINKKEYFVKKSLDRLYRYTIDDLSNYIVELAMIDRNIKMGKDNVGSFELFLFNR